jgi:hypothetical protein
MKKSKLFLTGILGVLLVFGLILTGCNNLLDTSAVSTITVSPGTAIVAAGGAQQFNAVVGGVNNPAQTVTWSVERGGAGTGITNAGLLTVAAGETAQTLIVKATSTVDASKSGTAAVTVYAIPGTVLAVTVSPATPGVVKGGTQQFSFAVTGPNNPAQTVTWSVEGGGEGTGITDAGLLTVAAGETAQTLTVKAAYTADTTAFGTATVTVYASQTDIPTVSSVSVSPAAASVAKGTALRFSAEVSGSNDPAQTVTWSVEGGVTGTGITGGGILLVAAGETAATLTVKAISTVDTAKSGTAAVTIIGEGLEVMFNGKASDVYTITGEITIDGAFAEYRKNNGDDGGPSTFAEFLAAGGELYINGEKVVSSAHTIKPDDILLALFPKRSGDGNGNGNEDWGTQIGKISGFITLTDIPSPVPTVSLSARSGDWSWSSRSSRISLSGVSGSAANNIAWTLPLYENDSYGTLQGKTGTETIYFRLYADDGFRVELGSRDLNLGDKSDIQAGNLGAASLASITLSGTININDGGRPVRSVSIGTRQRVGENEFSEYGYGIDLESPAVGGAPWLIRLPPQDAGTEITFSLQVFAADGSFFYKELSLSPAATKSVSNQPVSGILLDIGDINTWGRMRGTVTFTNMPSPPPDRIYLSASYEDGDGIHAEFGYTSVTLSGNTGTWSMDCSDDFLAALESGDQRVLFSLHVGIEDYTYSPDPIEKTIGKNGIGAVNLGTVAMPNFIKLSGTFTGTYNGGTLPLVQIDARTPEGGYLGLISLFEPAAGASWSMTMPALDSPAKVDFFVSANSSDYTSLFHNLPVSPSQTRAVFNQSISGTGINIGNIKPDTLRVENPPQGSYTAYIRDPNSDSQLATGTGNGSSIPLVWDSSADKGWYYYVLISAGGVTKFTMNSVDFFNGIGSVDWNGMTEVSGGGN